MGKGSIGPGALLSGCVCESRPIVPIVSPPEGCVSTRENANQINTAKCWSNNALHKSIRVRIGSVCVCVEAHPRLVRALFFDTFCMGSVHKW